jgi:transposase
VCISSAKFLRKFIDGFVRFGNGPGDQGQVDWAYLGEHTVGRAERPLWAFVMVLSLSRKVLLPLGAQARKVARDPVALWRDSLLDRWLG